MLDTYYRINKDMAEKVLRKKSLLWKNYRLIDVAGEFDLKTFFREQACQNVMDKEWKGVSMSNIFQKVLTSTILFSDN